MLEYVANLCSTLFVDNDFSGLAWEPCVKPYLSCFLPPDEAAMACELFRTRTEKQVSFPTPVRTHILLPMFYFEIIARFF
jgi:hypothetical protein